MFNRIVHPGLILKDELEEAGVSPTEFARQIDVPANRVSQILAGKRAVDGRKYGQLTLKPDRLATFKSQSAHNSVVEGTKGGQLKDVYPLDTPERMGNTDQDFANWSVDFIKGAAQAKKPFYLIHAFAKVHFDNYPGDGYKGRSPAKLPYKDAVVEVDDIVGRLMATLRETGEADNTFVFFTSDMALKRTPTPAAATRRSRVAKVLPGKAA